MECQKNVGLQATNDAEYLITDSFIFEGQLTDLYLYPQHLSIIQKHNHRNIPLQFGLNFTIIQGIHAQPFGLQFSCGEATIRMQRQFWPRAREWEEILLKHLTRGDFHELFRPLRKVGRGNFATVYLADDLRAGRKVAIKAFMKETAYKGDGRAGIENEIKLMRRTKQPNIVSLHGVYETKNSLYLSMEFIEGHSLDTFLRKHKSTTVEQRRKLMRGLLSGLKELSKLRILHRDIKPENIMVSEDCEVVKIIDFGLAADIDEPHYIFVRCGTPGFVAPEILKIRDVDNARLGVQADMFSLGAIYYHLVYGQPLFPGKDQNQVLGLNRQCKIKIQPKEGLAFGEFQLLCSMLQYDPKCRITPDQALKSRFLQEKKDIFLRALQPIEPETANEWIFDQM